MINKLKENKLILIIFIIGIIAFIVLYDQAETKKKEEEQKCKTQGMNINGTIIEIE